MTCRLAAIESLTLNMAEAIAPQGLRVNAVIPAFTENGHEAFRNKQAREYMSSFAVLAGVSSAETIADAVAFLISDKACRTTGITIDVTGGSTIDARGSRVHGLSERLP